MQSLDPDLAALQEVRDLVERAARAQESVARFSQEKIDAVCEAMAKAAARAAFDLAKLAVEETGIGRVHYKILKNLLGSEGTWASIKSEKTVGILAREIEELRDDEIRHHVVDRRTEEDDPLFEQERVDVIGPLAPVGRLDDHRY